MFVIGFPATALATNCFVVAPSRGEECLIIDPGIGITDRLREVLAEHRLRPAAVLATHGHLDHVFSVTPVCQSHGVTAYIHAADQYRLRDPLAGLGEPLRLMLESEFGALPAWDEPEDVRSFGETARMSVAGLDVSLLHAPGHTEGSTMFKIAGVPDAIGSGSGLTRTIFAGDVLFAGGVGRTDLPGGDAETMTATLRDVVLAQEDDSLVLPGHGPATTLKRERFTNPYLQGLST